MFIAFEKITNARDLGGIALSGGRRVRPGCLIRSAALDKATDADIARLEAMGLYAVADFRDGTELERSPDRAVPGAKYVHLPALPPFSDTDGPARRRDAAPDFDRTFTDIYTRLATGEEARLAFRGFFELLLEADGRPVLWHCTQGKDRTGVAAILLLTALGASREDMEADFFLSREGLRWMLDPPFPAHMLSWPAEQREKLAMVQPEYLAVFMELVKERHGGVADYLRQALGLTERETDSLRERYSL